MNKLTSFEYTHIEPFGLTEPLRVAIEPMNSDYLAWRLKISTAQAEKLQVQRAEAQRLKLPNLLGEYVINMLGYGGAGLQKAHMGALVAHGQTLGLPEQVYGGYRAWGFLWDGTFFGQHSDDGSRKVSQRRQFHAAQFTYWREQAGYAKNNPFDHMTRGEKPGKPAPILATFSMAMLEAPEISAITDPNNTPSLSLFSRREPSIGYDSTLWQPKDSLEIEDTVQVVYHRGLV